MRRHISTPLQRRAFPWALLIVLALSAVTVLSMGCKSRNAPIIEFVGGTDSTGTVQATMTAEAPSTAPATPSTATPGTDAGVGAGAGAAGGSSLSAGAGAQAPLKKPTRRVPTGIWPARVGTFAVNVKSPVWFPKKLPAGYNIASLDVVEFDPGSGLVCDIVWLKGETVVQLIQGSPKSRSYDVVSSGKTAWGSQKADIVHQDPADPQSPVIIVYSNGGNFAELSGDLPLSSLKTIAASMVVVK